MSGWRTIAPYRYYTIFINPGGPERNPPPLGESVGESLHEADRDWNYWLDDAKPQAKAYYNRVMETLGGDRLVPVTNAVFLRSSQKKKLPIDADDVFLHHCAPVHRLLMHIVQPRIVICFGIPTWEYITGHGDPGRWGFFPDLSLSPEIGYRCGVLFVPHYSQGGRMAWSRNEEKIRESLQRAEFG